MPSEKGRRGKRPAIRFPRIPFHSLLTLLAMTRGCFITHSHAGHFTGRRQNAPRGGDRRDPEVMKQLLRLNWRPPPEIHESQLILPPQSPLFHYG